jgi:hypothetical protein
VNTLKLRLPHGRLRRALSLRIPSIEEYCRSLSSLTAESQHSAKAQRKNDPCQNPARIQQAPVGCIIKGELQQHAIGSRKQNRQPHPPPPHILALLCPGQRTPRRVSQHQLHVASKMHGSSSSAQSLIAEGRVMRQDTSRTSPEITRTTKVTLWGLRAHPHHPLQDQHFAIGDKPDADLG